MPKCGRTETASGPAGEPPVIDIAPAPGTAPDAMVWIPAGEFSMGSDEPTFGDARPIHRVKLHGFWMDKTEITNEQFEKFIKATGYVTIAERKPRAEDFPGAPPENLVAGSVVFYAAADSRTAQRPLAMVELCTGSQLAASRRDQRATLRAKEKHPVVHIAYPDALEFAKWAGKRLPTEAEFEWAARGGLDRKKYVWGDDFRPDEKYLRKQLSGTFSRQEYGRGRICNDRTRRQLCCPTDSAFLTWPVTSGNGARTGTTPPIMPSLPKQALRTTRKGQKKALTPGARRHKTRAKRRLVPLHRSILLAIHARRPRQRRARYGH